MALDKIHYDVRKALEKLGWKITDDPLEVFSIDTYLKIDLGVERVIAAERNGNRIAIEIKSLAGASILYSFYEAFGQYVFYRDALQDEGYEWEIFLATSHHAYLRLTLNKFLMKRIAQYGIKLLIVDIDDQIIVEWKK